MVPDRKLSTRTGAWIRVVTLLVLLATVALVSQKFIHGRVDLTRDRQFTLSQATRNILADLPDPVTVRVVMSRDLPTRFQQMRTRIADLLREFEARSGGKVNVVFEDPADDEIKRQAALSMGIQEVQLQEQDREGMQVRRGFFGMALLYGDRKEVFPVVGNIETLEYDLIVRLMRITGVMKTLGVVEGADGNKFSFASPGESAPTVGFDQNFRALRSEMEPLYRVESVRPAQSPVGDEVAALIVAAPRHLTETEKFRIDQFILSGRPVLFLSQGMEVRITAATGITATPAVNGYEDLLAHYGLGVRRNMLLEPGQWETVHFGTSMFPQPYPYWIVPTYTTLNPENPVTAGMQSMSFPWASSIEIDTAAQPGATIETLVFTTDQAWEETGQQYLYPRELKEYRPHDQRMFPLVALSTGIFTSRYAEGAPEGIPAAEAKRALRESRDISRLMVVSNALFATDFYNGYIDAQSNRHFVLNALDYLALDPDFIRVRSRQIHEAPLNEEVVNRFKTPILFVNMLLVPLFVVLAGLIHGVRTRRREAGA